VDIEVKEVKDGAVIYPHGEIDISNVSELQREITALIERGITNIVLNLSYVDHMDSSGIGLIAFDHIKASRNRKSLKLAAVTEEVMRILTIIGLDSVLDIYDTEEEAIASFS